MSKPIQVGVIGAGANTKLHHIPKFQGIEGVSVVGVCNRSRESGDRVAREFGIPRVFENWQSVVEDPSIDAVVIGTWPYTHCEMTCAALVAGKHVLCEARMAMNAAGANTMLETSRAHPECVAQIVPSPFTLKFDRTLKRLVEERFIGDLFAVDMNGGMGGFADVEAPMSWRKDMALSGMNIMAMGIWYEAMARWVGHASTVFAQSNVFIHERPGADGTPAPVEIPDHITVLMDLECGAQASLRCSEVTGLAPNPFTAFLYGRDGTLHLDPGQGKLLAATRAGDGFAEIEIPDHEAQHWRVEEEFVGAIRGDEEIKLTSFDTAVKYMEFTEADDRSAKSGSAVGLPLRE